MTDYNTWTREGWSRVASDVFVWQGPGGFRLYDTGEGSWGVIDLNGVLPSVTADTIDEAATEAESIWAEYNRTLQVDGPDADALQYTAQDVWGFGSILIAAPEDDNAGENVQRFSATLNLVAAEEYGIKEFHFPQDAIDQSRDLIIDEAARRLGIDEWHIENGTLLLIDHRLMGWRDDVLAALRRHINA
jgi:hypothetical protein